jgi:hypothetical protein
MEPDDIEFIYKFSPIQQAMLFHSLYAPGSGVYVVQMNLELTGRLDVPALERAWREVLEVSPFTRCRAATTRSCGPRRSTSSAGRSARFSRRPSAVSWGRRGSW